MLNSSFSGQDLRDLRESQKVSQAKLAKETSIVQAKISSFELGKGNLLEEEKNIILKFFSNSIEVEKVVKAKKKITKESNFVINLLDIEKRKKQYNLSPKTKKYVNELDDLYTNHLNSQKKFKAVSLFSGCGGLCLGFSAAGVRIAGFIEKDKDNTFIEEYRNKGYAVVIEDIVNSTLDPEDYKNLKYSIISLGDDRLNIDFAIDLINILSSVNTNFAKLLVIHIENDELKEL